MSYEPGENGEDNTSQSAYQRYGIAAIPGGMGYQHYQNQRARGKSARRAAAEATGLEILRILSLAIPTPGPWLIITGAVVALDNEPTEPLEEITERAERTSPPQTFRT
ncbi:hypothetical protein HN419_02730 [Candidatus Woesearchaeota archaeon]|jgi:hypothetical protein|nr:hypothetical protein [Candidatus Woesearchaeota archaeon]MBT3537087.1 hypothetical protein [Candidatus Woesearchaeota archaeon]MBT4697228.1 hypothetical protein [Candidatus Woesearchaeota archaeon]MBT4717007.1 hypothetical protein [Candidatus Woesearchaeota archaeon]MBT7106603.1 hypothetical protein [Candidatus Woesearchaeota archaeon]